MKELCQKLRWWESLSVMLTVVLLVGSNVSSAQVNAVYVNGNIGTVSNANVVYGYSNNGFGNLTALPGSPYSTGGTGTAPPTGMTLGLQTDDDQQVIINRTGTFLFTVNGFSNTIASFGINSDGSLTPVAGSPFNSSGPQTMSLGLFDGALGNSVSLLVAVNKASDPNQTSTKKPNLQTFTVASDGTMTHNVGSQVLLQAGGSPSQAAIGPSHLTFVMEFAGTALPPTVSQIDSYRIMANGHLKLNNSVQVPAGDHVFLGEVVHPTQNVLYAALPADNLIGVYSFSQATGILTFVTTVTNPGSLSCWLTVNTSGTRLYSAETMSNSITVYDITNATAPVQLQHLSLTPTTSGSGATNLRVDPTGQFLYGLSNSPTSSSLHVMNLASDGTMTETVAPVTLPVPANNWPVGIGTVLK